MYVIDCVDCSVFSVHVSCVYADFSESYNSRAIGDTTLYVQKGPLEWLLEAKTGPSSSLTSHSKVLLEKSSYMGFR